MPLNHSKPPEELPPEELRRKQTFERSLIILSVLLLALLTVVQRQLLNLGPGLSSNQGVITLVSINISIFILGLLLFLILRGLYRIYFERRHYGSLQTKMVVSFISLSLIPTLLIFYFSYLLIGQDHETWFSSSIHETFQDALSLSEYTQEIDRRLLISGIEGFKSDLTAYLAQSPLPAEPKELPSFLEAKRMAIALDSAGFYGPDGAPLVLTGGQKNQDPLDPLWLQSLTQNSGSQPDMPAATTNQPPTLWSKPEGGLKLYATPVNVNQELAGFLVVGSLSQAVIETKVEEIRLGLAKYRAALGISQPFRVAQMTSLAGVTLLAVFLSIWIGSHLASSLSAPITELVDGTRRVAKGELDFVLTPINKSGEMAQLVSAFNQMTLELKESYSELDRRRRFLETILRQVSSGVLIFDLDSHLVNLNQAARDLLKLTEPEPLAQQPALIKQLLELRLQGPRPANHVFLEVEDKTLSLTLRRAPLFDEDGNSLGFLITFDDLSELEKAQRLAAWREVARRIAHEIKNPLTPISLSAQRLRRRFGERLSSEEDGGIFDECTAVIVRQVENMRRLVDEFSQFARLPEINPKPADLLKVADQTLALFRSAHPAIQFAIEVKRKPETFIFDPEQLGRVITNLLANAAAATKGRGVIKLTVDLDDLTGVSLTVADDGPGLSTELRDRIFEPYVTTGPEGQGLGLAIVSAIVRDHGGFIRVTDNRPTGTCFVVTIPYRLS
ncbi:MAG: HAMP domain-containing protein [Deltaproteobacteria bacterium]|jgi:two-component system nitrogen regulation sensor histidine kinase NtrY|nr:HAMP domain-containing protein [Deltaproteobacteria bacterium]